jgi:beta-hydroxyacyl-ACP dehydratase FabZ
MWMRGTGAGMQLDINEIQKFLPHRYPFLLIDRVIEMERYKRIVTIKNVTINESFFQGHFPGKPIMPGVLILESMAQSGGLLLLQEIPDREEKLLYLASMNDVKFRRPVVPGDQLRVEVDILAWKGDLCKIQAKAFVGENLATQATLMCVMVDRDKGDNAGK